MSLVARKILRRYDRHRFSHAAVVAAWEGHLIDASEFGQIIGEAV